MSIGKSVVHIMGGVLLFLLLGYFIYVGGQV